MSVTASGAFTSNATAPQWHPPLCQVAFGFERAMSVLPLDVGGTEIGGPCHLRTEHVADLVERLPLADLALLRENPRRVPRDVGKEQSPDVRLVERAHERD